jgi:hypothetical protein
MSTDKLNSQSPESIGMPLLPLRVIEIGANWRLALWIKHRDTLGLFFGGY